MTLEEQKSILTIALYAAFSDGAKDDREREEIRRIAESLAEESDQPELSRLYQDVLLRRVTIEDATTRLTDPGTRQLAYEMSVCVCDADGLQSAPERLFLAELRALLQLDAGQTEAFDQEVEAIVQSSEATRSPARPGEAVVSPAQTAIAQALPSDAELDKSILNYALFNGALELLPQSWASMAIIPLQVKMVYAIGKAHGVELDQGHIKEFIAAAGVGLTSQYLEQFGRKLLGGLLGKAAGKVFGKVGGTATGMAFSFATTYALGQLAKRYYAGGRTMSTSVLRDAFQNLLEPAKQLQTQYLPQIRQQAETIDMGRVMSMIRGG
jgi:uncharacterized protein (DUF697 family)/tellurite resistance protein